MMSRFQAGLKGIKEAAGKPAAAVEDAPHVEAEAPTYQAPPSRKGKVGIAAYFDPAVRKQLAILSIHQEKSQAALMAEAFNLLFEHYGEPPIASA
jgi:hypothetical protein